MEVLTQFAKDLPTCGPLFVSESERQNVALPG